MIDVSSLPKHPAVVARIADELARIKAGREALREPFEEAEASVRSWVWSTEQTVPLIPLEHEMAGGAVKAKTFKAAPDDPKKVYALGFDDRGRLAFWKHYDFTGRLS